ncbi:MAG: TetR/AcrR family transcriptional regulator [Phycisphaerae bacterium]|jgi:AcrR family transcriptional regulator|nr:TetR/AcrR family transcriptional regulator [Phycisphaerae bacterium]
MEAERKGDRTRRRLLEAAFDVISRKGFQSAGLGEILTLTGLTKGALYHHFGDKTALGYAVLDEIVGEIIEKRWIAPLGAEGDPLMIIPEAMRTAAGNMKDRDIQLGCPLGNLAAEMSALDAGFAQRIDAIYQKWRDALSALLIAAENVSDDDSERIATFIVAALSGCLAQAKSTARREVLLDGIVELSFCIEQLGTESPQEPQPQYVQSSSTGEIEDYLL